MSRLARYPNFIRAITDEHARNGNICDHCNPATQNTQNRCFAAHHEVIIAPSDSLNQHGQAYYAPLQLDLYRPSEVTNLVQSTIQYTSVSPTQLNPTQLQALFDLNVWIRTHQYTLLSLTSATIDRSTLMTSQMMRDLWRAVNWLFFGGYLHRLCFQYTESIGAAYGIAFVRNPDRCLAVRLHPTARVDAAYPQYGATTVLHVVSTLLHELCHVYLERFGCAGCPSFNREVMSAEGHGNAWQLLASHVERQILCFTGLPVELGRLETALLYFYAWKDTPCPIKVRAWGLPEELEREVWKKCLFYLTWKKNRNEHDDFLIADQWAEFGQSKTSWPALLYNLKLVAAYENMVNREYWAHGLYQLKMKMILAKGAQC